MEMGSPMCGVDFTLEEQANAILREGRRGITALSQKKDYLTEEQLALRQGREVYNVNGVPDIHINVGTVPAGLQSRCRCQADRPERQRGVAVTIASDRRGPPTPQKYVDRIDERCGQGDRADQGQRRRGGGIET